MVTAIVLTKNEEKNIVDCLESLSFCDEILVIDDYSSDRTAEIAKKMGATVFVHPLDNNFSKQRNYGLNKAKNTWVLSIDADERVSKNLSDEIIKRVRENKADGFLIKREDTIWGKKIMYGELGSIWLLRLAKKESGSWKGIIHEKWIINGKVNKLKSILDHYPHQTLSEFLKEINYYTDLRAKELKEEGVVVNWYSIILYPKGKFLLNYILKLGFLDGLEGLVFAIVMSFHSFLVRSKLWLLNQD